MSADQTTYGPHNPHPLSNCRMELIWEGKYDENGNRREVDIAGCAMPLQRIETVDEPSSRLGGLGLTLSSRAHTDDFRNLLIWGDNKLIIASLIEKYADKIDLIYIDPPFDVGADFTMQIPIGDEDFIIDKDQSTLEMVAYRDIWGKGIDSYLHMMYERLNLMRYLLSETGSIFVHLDWHVSHYVKILLDEIFGSGGRNGADHLPGYRNEIVYCYSGGGIPPKEFPRKHDTILWYTKSGKWTFNTWYREYSEGTKQRGRTAVKGPDAKLRDEGTPINDWWTDVKKITSPTDPEKLYYSTQKSEELLERIISIGSNEGDLVADFFCGSGTTGAVAERLGRRWIMCDLGRFAIHTTRKRMIEVQRKLHEEGKPYRAFDVYNLGRYERQWWQKERLLGADEEHRRVVLGFYKAEPLSSASSPLLHGRKGPALVHVDAIDGIFTRVELRTVVEAAASAGAKELHCLAWEFEMDLKMICAELEAATGVKIRLFHIPREIMERNRTNPPPFFEMATLRAEPVYRSLPGGRRGVDIKLVEFIPSLAEVPEKEREALQERAIESGFDFIDFWAVDFDYQTGQPFEHHWQAYRTRKNRKLPLVSDHGFDKYDKPGKHLACVKVVDVFGVDTSITVEVEI